MCAHAPPPLHKKRGKKEKPIPVPGAPNLILELFIYTWVTPPDNFKILEGGLPQLYCHSQGLSILQFTHSFVPISVCHGHTMSDL